MTAGKEGTIYLIDRDDMGHFDPSADYVVQELPGALNGQLGNPAYFNGEIYYATPGFGTDVAKAFSISDGVLSTSPTSTSGDSFTWRGGTTSVSAAGADNGVVWALDGGSGQLRAYDAADLGRVLYTSAQAAGGRDQLGTVVKFTVPTVAEHVTVNPSPRRALRRVETQLLPLTALPRARSTPARSAGPLCGICARNW